MLDTVVVLASRRRSAKRSLVYGLRLSWALSASLVVLSLSLVLSVALAAPGRAADEPVAISQQAMQQIAAIQQEKASWTPAQCKIGSELLLAAKKSRRASMAAGMPEPRSSIELDSENRVLVDVKADVTADLLDRIKALGGEVVSSFPQYHAVRARIPITQVEALAAEGAVQSIRPADIAITNKTNSSEGDVAHRADDARATFGFSGTGIKVGVLSDSVDSLATLQGSGDLPATVTVLPGQSGNPDTSEGTAMLEIVYDLAPGASLYFATANGSQAGFASNILALQAAGCNVIVDDMQYFREPVFQDGIIAQAVETVSAAGALYFSSAGNSGNQNDGTSGVWEGNFAPMAAPPVIVYGTAHNFGGGANFDLITADSPFSFTLQWSDPMGGSANDYDLFLLDATRTVVFAWSNDVQNGSQDPFEDINSRSNDTGNTLVVIKNTGAANRYLHLNANRGQLGTSTSGQTWGHSAAASAYSVAAVNVATAGGGVFTGGPSNPVETFSSDGPRRVFYLADGTPITPGNFSSTGGTVRQKPDIAAADCVATATPGFNSFCGTSAAAPHAAAIAALVLGRFPSLTPSEIRTALTSAALDIEAAGVDRDSGYGIVDAMAVMKVMNDLRPWPPVVASLDRQTPTGQTTNASSVTWRVAFNEPVDASTVSTLDFTLVDVSSSITGEFIQATGPTSGATTTIDVTVNTGTGDGTLRLDVMAAATISDLAGYDYNSNYTSGQTYIIDRTPPTVVSVDRQTPTGQNTNQSHVAWRVTFNEPVDGLTVRYPDFTLVDVSSSITGEFIQTTGSNSGATTTIDVTVNTGTGNGTLRLDVLAAATISDLAGNWYDSNYTSGQTYIIDKTPPTVVSVNRQTPTGQNTNASSVTWRVTFNEPVDASTVSTSDFTLVDVSSSITGESNTSTSPTSGTTTTIDVTVNTGTGDGTLRLDVPAAATISDLVGNDYNSNYTSGQTYIIDKTPPTVVSVNRLAPTGQNTHASSVTWRVTFNEPVDASTVDIWDFTLVDVSHSITGESKTFTSPGSGATTTIDVQVNTGTGDGTLRLDVLGWEATISDLVGNGYYDDYTSGQTYIIEKTPPTVVSVNRQTPTGQNTNASSVTWRVTFNEPIDASTVSTLDFTLVDVSSSITGESNTSTSPTSGTTTTIDVTVNTGTGDGTLQLDVLAAATISDLFGNDYNSNYTIGQTYVIDKTPPTVVSVDRLIPGGQTTNASSVTWRVTFNERVDASTVSTLDFTLVDVLSSITGESNTSTSPTSGTTMAIDVTANTGTGGGTLRLDVLAAATISDLMGYDYNSNYTIGQTYIIDNTPPAVVSVDRQTPTGQNTGASSVTWRVTFSKPIDASTVSTSDFTLVDVSSSITGESKTSTSPTFSATTTIDVTVWTGTGDGTLRLDVLAAATISDLVGNDYNSNYTIGQTYIIEKTPPTVVSVNRQTPTGQNTNASSVTWRVTFNEPVDASTVSTLDFTLVDVSSSITGESNTSTSPTSGTTTTIDVTVNTGTGDGTLQLDVLAAATISDLFGNDYNSNYTIGQTYVIDKVTLTTTAAPAGGLYNSDQNVSLTPDETATVYYTTDGTEPTTGSNVYYPPSIAITADTTLRFFAVDPAGNEESPKKQEVYVILTSNGSIAAAKQQDEWSEVRLGGKDLYLKWPTFGYIEEPGLIPGRGGVSGVRVEGALTAPQGTRVSLVGTIMKGPGLEVFILVSAMTLNGPATVRPYAAGNYAVQQTMMDGLYLTTFGRVKPGSVVGNSYVITDGADSAGIKVITRFPPTVLEGGYVIVTGAAGYGYDGGRVVYESTPSTPL